MDTEKAYTDCINEIPFKKFTMKKIEECIGKESLYIRDDFDHLMKSINAKYEEKVRDIMFNKCFKYSVVDANNDRERACTLFQDDIIDLIWQ